MFYVSMYLKMKIKNRKTNVTAVPAADLWESAHLSGRAVKTLFSKSVGCGFSLSPTRDLGGISVKGNAAFTDAEKLFHL